MKKLFVALLLIISIKSFAQSQNDFNYAVGIKLLAIEEFPKLLNEVREKTAFQNTSLNGLMLKINDNQISYRFQAYNSKIDNYTFTNECATCEEVAGVYKSFDFKIGFARSLIYSKLQPFYGFDLGFKRARFDGKSNDVNTNAFLYNTSIEKNGALIYGFFGLKYSIIPQVTLSAEAGLDYIYTYDKEIKSSNSNLVISQNKFDRVQFTTKPLGLLSLQFNFGQD